MLREDASGRGERAVRLVERHPAEHAVAVAMLLAQVHVQAAGEQAAQHFVRDEHRHAVRIACVEQPTHDPHLRLRRSRLVQRRDVAPGERR